MQKNVSGQKWVVFAFDETDNTAKTGDAANITANLRIDGGAANAVDDTNPTELEDGYYVFDITQAESNGDYILICPASSTADIQVIGCPAAIFTRPPNFNDLGIESDGDLTKVNSLDGHTVQTGDSYGVVSSGTFGNSALKDLIDVIDGIVDNILTDTGTTLDTNISTLLSRLSAARAGYLDELGAANIPADVDTLLTRLSAARAGYLDNLSAGAVALASALTTVDTVVDAIKAVTDNLPDGGALTTIGTDAARLTADRAAVLTDWIDGGRLDLLLDAIPTTAMRGTDNAALASVCTEARLQALTDWIDGGRLDLLLDAIKAVTDALPDAGALNDLAAILTDTGTTIPGLIAELNNISVANITGAEVDNDGTAISIAGAFKLILSALCGKSSGGGTSIIVFRDIADTKNRISVTVDANGNRTAVGTRDAT